MFLIPLNKINLTFCGMMGSGKSIIARKVAKIIDFKHIDTDKLIEEKMGKSISKIFENEGEKRFREIEEEVISKILNKKNFVISLGGGSLINKKIRNIIKKNSFNIYLDVSINKLKNRLAASQNRPLIKNTNLKSKLIEIYEKRKSFYNQADLIINNENNLSKTINDLKKKLKINEKNN